MSSEFDIIVGRFGDGFVVESEAADTDSVLHDASDIVECAGENEQDIGGIDLNDILLRSIFGAVRSECDGTGFNHFEQSLLNTFAADITSFVAARCDFINFVDADDTFGSAFDIFSGSDP